MAGGSATGPVAAAPASGSAPRPLRLLLGAFGDPGHAFPMLALGRELAARGHAVTFQTWGRWQDAVEAEGMMFQPAPEYHVFPTRPRPLKPYEAVVHATRDTAGAIAELAPDAVVADILTLSPALAGELAGAPVATLIPHVHPATAAGFPTYSIGARLPATRTGAALWGIVNRLASGGLRQGRDELNQTRRLLGLDPLPYLHGGISRRLAMVATFPQLEYPRPWPANTHVIGPLMWEPPYHDVELPPGDDPLVLVAPSTSQDPEHRLLRAALEGLGQQPVRVLATWNRRPPTRPLKVPANARLVEWVSYSRTMPRCDVVVCHGGHGTLMRALSNGCPVVACPAGGDMYENAARIDWAGVGVRVPGRFVTPWGVRLAVIRAVQDARMRERAKELGSWLASRDPAAYAAGLVEQLAREREGLGASAAA